MAGAGAGVTIILIVVFAAALAMGMLFLLGTKRQINESGALKGGRHKPPPPGYFSGLVSLYKWAFNYNVRAASTVVSVESQTQISRPPAPAAVAVVSVEPGTPAVTIPTTNPLKRQVLPAASITGTPAILTTPLPPHLLPPVPAPARPSAPSPLPAPVQTAPPPAMPPRAYGLQAIIDILGDGIETALIVMADGVVFICEAFINVFKWIFRIDR